MEMRKKLHDNHPNYQKYDFACLQWRRAQSYWFRVINNRAREDEVKLMLLYLREAQGIFEELAEKDFLSARSYVEKIKEKHRLLEFKKKYDVGVDYMRKADNVRRSSQKRELYELAMEQFMQVGSYSCAEYCLERCRKKYLATFDEADSLSVYSEPRVSSVIFWSRHRHAESDEEKGCSPLKILLEGGYDLCVRPKLPPRSCELQTTTIITPDGAYQVNKQSGGYACVLDADELKALHLGEYLLAAKSRESLSFKEQRQSIKASLSEKQIEDLNQALVAKGGHPLEEVETWSKRSAEKGLNLLHL